MPRKVFFSFHYDRDSSRAAIVRNSQVVKSKYSQNAFLDHADWEEVKRKGDDSIRRWIDNQLDGSTITCVLIGYETNSRKWIHYEIKKSLERKNAILGIRVHNIHNIIKPYPKVDEPGINPLTSFTLAHYNLSRFAPTYDWVFDDGYRNMQSWIDHAILKFNLVGSFRG